MNLPIRIFVCTAIVSQGICSGGYGYSMPAHAIEAQQASLYLYSYKEKEIIRFLRESGYSRYLESKKKLRFSGKITRNSEGTSLRFFSHDSDSALVVSCDGTIAEVPLPARSAWLDEKNEVVSWYDNGRIRLTNGKVHSGEPGYFYFDPSGKYFAKYPFVNSNTLSRNVTEIYSVEHPNVALARVRVVGSLSQLFSDETEVLLIGPDPENMNVLVVHSFEKKGVLIKSKDTVTIHRPRKLHSPFYIQDVMMRDDLALAIDPYDFPLSFLSKWRVYELNSGRLKASSKRYPYGFYMRCDVIESARKKLHDKSSSE